MRKLFYILTILTVIAFNCSAQDKVQFTSTISVNELKSSTFDNFKNEATVDVGFRINILPTESKWILAPAFSYQRQYTTSDFDYYYGGAEVAYKAGKFRFGGGFFLGTTDFDNLVRKYRGFADVKLTNHFGFRLFQAELQASGPFNFNNLTNTNRSTNYGTGIFLSF